MTQVVSGASMNRLARIGVGEFCAQAALTVGQGQWYALVLKTRNLVAEGASQVIDELAFLTPNSQVKRVSELSELIPWAEQGEASSGAVVVSLTQPLTSEHWTQLNFLRSRLLGEHAIIWVLCVEDLLEMGRWAPDLDTLLRASTWALDLSADQITDDEREQRLQSLREWAGMTDEEFLCQAEQGVLSSEPEYAEWLHLLGRGNLLVHQ